MGGDGGVIANQRRFLRGTSDEKTSNGSEDQVSDTRQKQRQRATHCAYSGDSLREPITCCQLGNLYNKEALLVALSEKRLHAAFTHIRGLRDIKTLLLTKNPSFNKDDLDNGGSVSDEKAPAQYICPVTLTELNGIHPFVVVWPNGHVLSAKAIREIGIAGLQEEYGPFSESDLVKLLPLEEEMDEIYAKLREQREREAASKKESKKRKAEKDAEGQQSSAQRSEQVSETNVKSDAKNSEIVSNKPNKSLSVAKSLSTSASKAIEEQKATSSVYSSLFHDSSETTKSDRDLFMSVAGIRYTLR